MRYFLYIKFDGTNFNGWQIQPNGITVQEEIEKALYKIFQEATLIMGAGRTDSGVHASCMVAHFDVKNKIDEQSTLFHLNNILPASIAIYTIRRVAEDFHARFAAISRTYYYNIIFEKDPFKNTFAHRINNQLDVDAMNEAAQLLIGKNDFSCFSKSKTQTFTNDCDITTAVWKRTGNGLQFEISANRFLRNMVRAIVGTLIEVGLGKRKVNSITELIASKNRSMAGTSMPAKGLFLVEIDYPEEGFI